MHIAVNTRLLLDDKLDGIGWFTHEVLSRLTEERPDWKFTFLFDRPFDDRFIYGPNVEGKVVWPPTRHPLLYRLYFDYTLPRALSALKPDLFFSPDGFLSLRTDIKQVPVIHDLNFEHRPQDLPSSYRNYYRSYFPKFAHQAHHILTVSDYSADDIASTYGINRAKITVAHNGYNPMYRPLDEKEKQETREQFSLGKPFFLFVGNFSYRKNVHGIIRAYDLYRTSGGTAKLLLVGNPLWKYDEMNEALQSSTYSEDIVLPGRLPIETLVMVMGSAEALVFPSYFEGFGIPILEAFAAGIPVITSTATSLPEIAGGGALLCHPDDIEKISQGMSLVQSSEIERFKLIEHGKIQLSSFSWKLTANKVNRVLFHSLTSH